jgi:hypothetical protein
MTSECYLVLDTTVSTRIVSTLGYWNYLRAALFAVKVCVPLFSAWTNWLTQF